MEPATAAGAQTMFVSRQTSLRMAISLQDLVTALKQSPVYVSPGLAGTTANTTTTFRNQCNADDNLIIVMLPSDVVASGDASAIESYAAQLDAATNSRHIIGLAIGAQVIGYSSLLPSGVAADLMSRAISVSTNTVETLSTYIRYVHSWQSAHPEATASKPADPSKQSGLNDSAFALGSVAGLMLVGAVVATMYVRNRRQSVARAEAIKFKKSPGPVREPLEKILRHQLSAIRDRSLQDTLRQICVDIEQYYSRISKSERELSASDVEKNLNTIEAILTKYIDVQNNPRYYENPRHLLEEGTSAVEGFGESVLDAIQNADRSALSNYRVSSRILTAQKFR